MPAKNLKFTKAERKETVRAIRNLKKLPANSDKP